MKTGSTFMFRCSASVEEHVRIVPCPRRGAPFTAHDQGISLASFAEEYSFGGLETESFSIPSIEGRRIYLHC